MAEAPDHREVLTKLATTEDWIAYLAANSGLPGPRANLSLAAAVGDLADLDRARELLATHDEYAIVCALVAVGRLFGEGDDTQVATLHVYAPDTRWRVREGVAMGVQRAADVDPERAFSLMETWSTEDHPLVLRAVVASVCEPRLLEDPVFARRALALVAAVTEWLSGRPYDERRTDPMRTLRQALGYGWSVAVAARPEEGLPMFDGLRTSDDTDVGWIVQENEKKDRLRRLIDR